MRMKIIKKFVLPMLFAMALFSGCSKRELAKENPTTDSGTALTESGSTIAAEWNQAKEGQQNGLLGGNLVSAAWSWDYETQSMKDITVTMDGKTSGETVIFAADELEVFEFFTGAGNMIFYLYAANEQYMIRKDIVDDNGNVTTLYDNAIDAAESDTGEENTLTAIRQGAADGSGRLSLLLFDGRLLSFDSEGNYAFVTDTSELKTEESLGEGLIVIGDELCYYQAETGRLTLYCLDYDKKALGGKEYISYEGNYYMAYSGYQYGLYIATDEGLCHYFANKGYDADLVSWESNKNGIVFDGIRDLGVTAEGNVCLYYVDGQSANMVELKAVSTDDYTERERVVLGGLSNDINDEVKEDVKNFNRYSKDYYIEILSYDFREEYSSFYKDLIRGEGADLFVMDGMPVENLARKGILKDLTPYFEASSVVKKDDLEETVWRAGEFAGGQYLVIPEFYPLGYLAADGALSAEEIFSMIEEYPDSIIINGMDSANAISLFLGVFSQEIESRLDMENGTCHFDDEKFIWILEKAKEYAGQKRTLNSSTGVGELLYNKELLLSTSNFTIRSYLEMKSGGVLDFASITGYPDSSGQVFYRLMRNRFYGMNSASRCKEGAWAFLEFLLSEEYQEKMNGSGAGNFSARKDVNEMLFAQLLDGTHPIYQTHYRNQYNGQPMEGYERFTEEDKALIKMIIDHSYLIDSITFNTVSEVVLEELQTYFTGDRTAEDTAKIIQQRLAIYLEEEN